MEEDEGREEVEGEEKEDSGGRGGERKRWRREGKEEERGKWRRKRKRKRG